MEDMLDGIGRGLTTFLQEMYKQRASSKAYLERAKQDDYQAALVAAQAEQKNTYLLQQTAQQARALQRDYVKNQSVNQAALAASGLRADSQSVQYMLQNNRFEALMQEKELADDLHASVSQNNAQAADEIRALKASALANRRAAYKRTGGWSLRSSLVNFLGGF